MDTTCPKNFTVMVKSSKRSVEGIEATFSDNILMCDITEIEEHVEGLDDIPGHIALECVHEDLVKLSKRNSFS